MTKERLGKNFGIRYSEAFKLKVVRELEEDDLPFSHVQRKYGIRGDFTVQAWARKYGNGTRGKVIRVENAQEIDEKKALKARVRALETALADSNLDLTLERAFAKLACQQAGIQDVAEFKKKWAGKQAMKP
jgi:transposase